MPRGGSKNRPLLPLGCAVLLLGLSACPGDPSPRPDVEADLETFDQGVPPGDLAPRPDTPGNPRDAGGSGGRCTQATVAADCLPSYRCENWGTVDVPDPRCTRPCDFWGKDPGGCEGTDLCYDNDLCVPLSLQKISKTFSGSCSASEVGYGCRVDDGKVKGICYPYPYYSFPICAVLCRPLGGFGNASADCVSSNDRCQPGLVDAAGNPEPDLGICSQ